VALKEVIDVAEHARPYAMLRLGSSAPTTDWDWRPLWTRQNTVISATSHFVSGVDLGPERHWQRGKC
jgi:hypothetical protein